MTFVLWKIPCEGERLCETIKHSWIKNQIEITRPEQAVKRSLDESGWAAFESDYPVRLRQSRELAAGLLDLFSPRSLIDHCAAFGPLGDDCKRELQDAVHAAYRESSEIESLRRPLDEAINRLENAIEDFRAACSNPKQMDQSAAFLSWEKVRNAGSNLRTSLDELPKGVVFP